MLTLIEFILKINRKEHFRVYQPNRDCLIYESFFEVHSPYFFDKEHETSGDWYNEKYFTNNSFCDNVRLNKEIDEETKVFLEKFGNYEVFSLECSSFTPCNITTDEEGHAFLQPIGKDPLRPNCNYIPCFDIFIKER